MKRIGCLMAALLVAAFAQAARADGSIPSESVIKYYFPKHIQFGVGEDCMHPAKKDESTGVALYHAGVHPKNSKVAMVTYALMFKRDCGLAGHTGALGADNHSGDIEFFHYTLKPDTTCSAGWRLHAVKTVAHAGDYKRREINEKILDTCDPPEQLVSSVGKHALYLTWGDCAMRTPAEVCLKGFNAGFRLYDTGTSADTGPDLSALFGGTDKLWVTDNSNNHFCGGMDVKTKDCVSFNVEKIVNNTGLDKWEYPDPDLGGNHKCPYGLDYSDGLCYKECSDGYEGHATMCVPGCPSGFRNDGLYCAKPDSYGRGAGYPWKGSDGVSDKGMFKRCEKAHGDNNCEKDGAIVYPKCKEGFKAVGCCTCSPKCPSGMKDIGVSCQKETHDRGVGSLP